MIRVKKEFHCPLHFPFCRQEISILLDRVLSFLDLAAYDLEVLFTDDQVQAQLNRKFLGLPGPTNVLSFPADEQDACFAIPAGRPLLGSLSISVQTWLRESLLYLQPPGEYLLRLLVHGVLHLSGLEHGEEMFSLTEEVVEHFSPDLDGYFVCCPFTIAR